jgi:hypothetical protein
MDEPSTAKQSTSSLLAFTNLKSKHEILNFMLCDLIPMVPLSQPNTTKFQKKSTIYSCAIMVLFALCHEPNAGKEPSDVATSAHLFVLSGLQFKMQLCPKNLLILAMLDFMLSQISLSISLPLPPLLKDPQQAPVRRQSKLQRSRLRKTMLLFYLTLCRC